MIRAFFVAQEHPPPDELDGLISANFAFANAGIAANAPDLLATVVNFPTVIELQSQKCLVNHACRLLTIDKRDKHLYAMK